MRVYIIFYVYILSVATTEEAELAGQTTGADQTSTVVKKGKKHSIPQAMATNPMYEASTPIYDCVTEGKQLKTLCDNGVGASIEMPAFGTLSLDIPPQLPVRKNTLESPGVKSTTQLVLKSAGEGEEYMVMNSAANSRYTKSPLTKTKLAEESMNLPDSEKE